VNIKSNLTAILVASLVAILAIALLIIVISGNDPDKYIGSISTLVGLLVTAGVIGGRLDKVSKNVNGNTTKVLNENAALRERNAYLEATFSETPKDNGFQASVPLMSEDTINRIKADRDDLPSHK
jgi:hypothetical protein